MANALIVAPDTPTLALRAAFAVDSPYDRVEFAPGTHLLTETLRVWKPGIVVVLQEGAVVTAAAGLKMFVDIRAPGVQIGGSGAFDASLQAAAGVKSTLVHVRNTGDGFLLSGDAKPSPESQAGALSFRQGTIGIVVDGADNVTLEKLHLHDFQPGTLGIVLRDVGDGDGLNADGGRGNLVRDLYAHGGQGGALPGQKPANGAWIRLDTSDGHDGSLGPSVQNVTITDTILEGGQANFAADGLQYFFVNIDSNIQHATAIAIAYNTLSGAASYEIQIKDGFPDPFGLTNIAVHDNIADHSDPGLSRRWPLKLQANHPTTLDVAFQNNLVLLQPGSGADDIHLAIGAFDGAEFRGDFVTDLLRRVVHTPNAAGHLVGSDADEWLIAGSSPVVLSGGGHDLIDVRPGSGVVRVNDFAPGIDQVRLEGFGLLNVLPLLRGSNGQAGFINLGDGDFLILRRDGVALDVSGLDSRDIFTAQTYREFAAPAAGGNLTGSEAADRLLGSDAADHLRGGARHDLLLGGAGADWLWGEAGNDRIDPGAGTDRLWGGAGADEFVFGNGRGLNVVYDWTDGQDKIALADGLTFADLTILSYIGRDAEVRSPDGSRLVLRNTDPATLGSEDFLIRGDGSAPIVGGLGRDVLHGTDAHDAFLLTPGTDWHYGYGGADDFVFQPGSGLNIVYDFEPGLDRIGLAGGLTYGDLTIAMYIGRDVDIQAPDGSRLVLRLIDAAEIGVDDFFPW